MRAHTHTTIATLASAHTLTQQSLHSQARTHSHNQQYSRMRAHTHTTIATLASALSPNHRTRMRAHGDANIATHPQELAHVQARERAHAVIMCHAHAHTHAHARAGARARAPSGTSRRRLGGARRAAADCRPQTAPRWPPGAGRASRAAPRRVPVRPRVRPRSSTPECVRALVHTRPHAGVHVRMRMRMHAYARRCRHIRKYVHAPTRTHARACKRAFTHTHTHTHTAGRSARRGCPDERASPGVRAPCVSHSDRRTAGGSEGERGRNEGATEREGDAGHVGNPITERPQLVIMIIIMICFLTFIS